MFKPRWAPEQIVLAFVFSLVAFSSFGVQGQENEAKQNQRHARETVDRMIAALGGEAYLSLRTVESEGRTGTFLHGRSEGATVFHRFWQWPDKERVEFTKQRDVAQLTIGDAMYEITFRGTRLIDMKGDPNAQMYVARRQHALEIVLRQWLSDRDAGLFYEGTGLAENHSVDRVTLMSSKNGAVTLSIDSETHLPVKKAFIFKNAEGQRDEISEIYDNWKIVQGAQTPFNTLVTRNGELVRQYFLGSVTYNQPLAQNLFQPFKAASQGR